jgi:DNA repair exonuclease SbcCD ATPase subunit
MTEDIRHHSTRVKRRRRHKSSVTNINIFALQPGAEGAIPETHAAADVQQAPAEVEEDLFGSVVSSDWLERRAKRLEKQEEAIKERTLELERREAELEEREARFEADMYLREDELEVRERELAELEARLGQKESDLGTFVARVQGGLLADAG